MSNLGAAGISQAKTNPWITQPIASRQPNRSMQRTIRKHHAAINLFTNDQRLHALQESLSAGMNRVFNATRLEGAYFEAKEVLNRLIDRANFSEISDFWNRVDFMLTAEGTEIGILDKEGVSLKYRREVSPDAFEIIDNLRDRINDVDEFKRKIAPFGSITGAIDKFDSMEAAFELALRNIDRKEYLSERQLNRVYETGTPIKLPLKKIIQVIEKEGEADSYPYYEIGEEEDEIVNVYKVCTPLEQTLRGTRWEGRTTIFENKIRRLYNAYKADRLNKLLSLLQAA